MIITDLITRCHLDNPVKLDEVTSVFIKYLNYACKITIIRFALVFSYIVFSCLDIPVKHSLSLFIYYIKCSINCNMFTVPNSKISRFVASILIYEISQKP
jgi:hypothetical protein